MSLYVTKSAEETQEIAQEVLQKLSGRNVIALYGDLGAGKTTFSQGIGKALGIKRHLQSPTFLIVRRYELRKKLESRISNVANLYHIDLYRITGESDIEGLGVREILNDPKNLVLIEWAEKIGSLLPEKRVDVRMEYVGEGERKIAIKILNSKH